MDWETNGSYCFSRVIGHGQRRTEDMGEAAATVREIGLDPTLASASAERQAWVAERARDGTFAATTAASPWRDCADLIAPDPVR